MMVIYITDQISEVPSKLTDAFYHPLEYLFTKELLSTQKGEGEKWDNRTQVTKGNSISSLLCVCVCFSLPKWIFKLEISD